MYNVVQEFYSKPPKGKIRKGLAKKALKSQSQTSKNEYPYQMQMQVTGEPVHNKRKSKFKRGRGGPNIPEPDKDRKICLTQCRYDVVRRTAVQAGFKDVLETEPWNIMWSDSPLTVDKAMEMRRFQDAHAIFWGKDSPLQKANHFPGMNEICRKDRLARNLNRMKRIFPAEYNFFPKSWCLPAEYPDLIIYAKDQKNATYICKPDSGSQGKGIFLLRNIKQINPNSRFICQLYIPRPLLLNGYKFDLRIYILITSCDPLRVYVYNEGIARFATVKYSPPSDDNVDIVFMHLTNYSLNKFSQSYVPDCDGSKRKLSDLFGFLIQQGYNVGKITDAIDDLVVKTMIAGQPTLAHYYRSAFQNNDHGSACFEILGFDILIDENLKPWLLEVNHSPSFNLDLPVDVEVKEALLRDTFNKIYLGGFVLTGKQCSIRKPKITPDFLETGRLDFIDGVPKSLEMQFHHEKVHQGNYRLVYPARNNEKYLQLFKEISGSFIEFGDLPEEIGKSSWGSKLFRSESSFPNNNSFPIAPCPFPTFKTLSEMQAEIQETPSSCSNKLRVTGKGVQKMKIGKNNQMELFASNALKRPGSSGNLSSISKTKKKGKTKKALLAKPENPDNGNAISQLPGSQAQDQNSIKIPKGTRKITYERISIFKNEPAPPQFNGSNFNSQIPELVGNKRITKKPPLPPKSKRDYVNEAIQRAQKTMNQNNNILQIQSNALLPTSSNKKQSELSVKVDKEFVELKKKLAEVKARELEYSYNSFEMFRGKPLPRNIHIPSMIIPDMLPPKFKTTEQNLQQRQQQISLSSFKQYPFKYQSQNIPQLYPPIFDESPENPQRARKYQHQISQAEFMKMLPPTPSTPTKKIKPNEPSTACSEVNKNKIVRNPITEKGDEAEFKKKFIEDWITTGQTERTRLIVDSQYSVLRNRHCAKYKKRNTVPPLIPKFGSGVHICEDNVELRRSAEYFEPPKIHQKINQIHKHKHSHNISLALLQQEENERKAGLLNREQLIRDLGIDTQAQAIVKKSGNGRQIQT